MLIKDLLENLSVKVSLERSRETVTPTVWHPKETLCGTEKDGDLYTSLVDFNTPVLVKSVITLIEQKYPERFGEYLPSLPCRKEGTGQNRTTLLYYSSKSISICYKRVYSNHLRI